MDRALKNQIIEQFRLSPNDTGSTHVQIAILTSRISQITEHLKIHKQDNHSRRGLIKLAGQRRKLLDYLKSTKPEDYSSLIEKLGIRK